MCRQRERQRHPSRRPNPSNANPPFPLVAPLVHHRPQLLIHSKPRPHSSPHPLRSHSPCVESPTHPASKCLEMLCVLIVLRANCPSCNMPKHRSLSNGVSRHSPSGVSVWRHTARFQLERGLLLVFQQHTPIRLDTGGRSTNNTSALILA